MQQSEGMLWLQGLLRDCGVLHGNEAGTDQVERLGAATALMLVAAAMFVNGGGRAEDQQAVRAMVQKLWYGGGIQWPAGNP